MKQERITYLKKELKQRKSEQKIFGCSMKAHIQNEKMQCELGMLEVLIDNDNLGKPKSK